VFCNHCGATMQAVAGFCASCGKPVTASAPAGAPPAPSGRLAKHLNILAVLWIAASALRLLESSGLFFAGRFLGRAGAEWGLEPMRWVSGFFPMLGAFTFLAAAAGIVCGWALLQRYDWARLLALVLAVLALLRFPFGTALGIYTLWVLLPTQSEQEYRATVRT